MPRRSIWRSSWNCPWWRPIRSSFLNATITRRTRRASALPKGTCWAIRDVRNSIPKSNTSNQRKKWPRSFPICLKPWPTRLKLPSDATCRSRSAQTICRISRPRKTSRSTIIYVRRRRRGLNIVCGNSTPIPMNGRNSARPTMRGSRSRRTRSFRWVIRATS